ncbi:MAG TPA: hypothetical protein DEP36_01010 [Gammaproteobacteria bacterium]|nr:hypothetical protein [Gammaproteobacteria bacterium]
MAHDYEIALSDQEKADLLAHADRMGISPEAAAAKFMRLHMLRVASASPQKKPGVVIPLRTGKGPVNQEPS